MEPYFSAAMPRTREAGAVLGSLLLAFASPAAAAQEPFGCGNLAPFSMVCSSPPSKWMDHTSVVVSTLGFVGTLTATVEWDSGAFTKVCPSAGLPYRYPFPAASCVEDGALPRAGTLVVLRCRAAPHPTTPHVMPAGPWACMAE
jgi:hypothetical protein